MSTLSPPPNEPEVSGVEDLELLFRQAETPPDQFLVGAEAEKFALQTDTLAAIPYEGQSSILSVLAGLEDKFGWQPAAEVPGGPKIALTRGKASITLEPGAQLELSGEPLANVHLVDAELREHFVELSAASRGLGMSWYSLGFHPTATPEQLSWVPKERYGIMKNYLPTRGSRGRDMMQRTATVQANFDYSDEQDAMRKLRAMLPLSPVFQAISANSPFYEGRISPRRSERADVWLNMDPVRSGLIEQLWSVPTPRYGDYVQWALDAGMFFFKRDGRVVHNTGQTFRAFLDDGFEGHRATLTDWSWHLGTLFPEVRLKTTLELRSSDSLPANLSAAMVALFTGLIYDEKALSEVEVLSRSLAAQAVKDAQKQVPERVMEAQLGGRPVRAIAESLLEIARGGLDRRNRLNAAGETESVYLAPLDRLIGLGRCPADELIGDQPVGAEVNSAMLAGAAVA